VLLHFSNSSFDVFSYCFIHKVISIVSTIINQLLINCCSMLQILVDTRNHLYYFGNQDLIVPWFIFSITRKISQQQQKWWTAAWHWWNIYCSYSTLFSGYGFILFLFVVFKHFNLLQLSGITILVIGTVIQIKYRLYVNIFGNDFLAAPILLICVGSVVAVLGFFGCCGAIRENYCMTMTVCFILHL
jgi:hypothetical protein